MIFSILPSGALLDPAVDGVEVARWNTSAA
jgi:hypothetical protein